MTYYPVIIPTLNRYQHFKKCIESLAACTHADKTELVIGLDYPPAEKYVDGWKKIKEYIPIIKGFSKITIIERDVNYGPFKNSYELKSYAISLYGAFIYTEDDNVFSPCFLDYMDKCLEKYKDDNHVMNICGFLPTEKFKINSNTSILRLQGAFSGWGFGRWKRSEQELRENVPNGYQKKICSSRKNLRKLKRIHLAGLYHIIFWANKENLNGLCDYTSRIYMDLTGDKYSIYPTISLVRNNGNDGSGVNCTVIEEDWVTKIPISCEKTYDLIENLNEDAIELNTKIWHEDENSSLSKKDRILTLLYYYSYMIFGYTFTKKMSLFKRRIKKIIKSN